MNSTIKTLLLLSCAALLAAIGHVGAQADGVTCSAHLGGMEAGKKSIPVLTVFNAQDVANDVDVDVVLRQADGTELATIEDALTLGPFESGSVDLWQEITRDLPKRTKPYQGLVSVTLTSDSPDFDPDALIVHVTQFLGSRKRPKGALQFGAVFRDEGT